MTKTPTNQQHNSTDKGKASASHSDGWNNGGHGFYDDMLELSLGSLTSLHNITLPSSDHPPRQEFQPPPPHASRLQRQNLSLPPDFLPSNPPREIQPPSAGPLQRQSLSLPSEFSFSATAALPLSASPPPALAARRYQPPPPALRVARTTAKPRKNSVRLGKGKSGKSKSETIIPPFEWATNRRATVHSLAYLDSKKIYEIKGAVQCKRCESQYEMGFDLIKSFSEVARFIWENRSEMADRAPEVWMNPTLPTCRYCGQENSAKPVIPRSKKTINWLFLLLGQMLGCCTLDQLRYFCKYRRHHRTGAKDRVLYLTYLNLCKQLDPTGPFDR